MDSVVAYFLIWGVVGWIANKHYKHHMAQYGIDDKGHHVTTEPHFHRRFDD